MRRELRAAAVTAAALFVALSALIATTGSVPGEQRLLQEGRAGDALRAVDAATDTPWLLLAAAALVALLVRHHPRRALLAATSVLGAIALNPLLKQLVDRPRPTVVALEDVSPLSFPSGHATGTAALALAAVLTAAGTRWLRAAAAAGALLVAGTAAAQLLLAHHHPSDLLGGWLWATAWTAAVWSIGEVPRRGGTRVG